VSIQCAAWLRLSLIAATICAVGWISNGRGLAHVWADAPGITLYVSPTLGSDSNPGSEAQPFATLGHAQAVVRTLAPTMSSTITVFLETGIFRLNRPLILDAEDSGRNGFNVVWSAAPGATPIIAGSDQITGWSEMNSARHIWRAPVPADANAGQIYVNGARAWQTSGAVPVILRQTSSGYKASSKLMSTWRNPFNIQFEYTGGEGQWAEPRCPIAFISGRNIIMAQPCWNNTTQRAQNYVTYGTTDNLTLPTGILNAYELLRSPGEFYLDTKLHVLYYIPRPGEDMSTADVEVPTLPALVRGAGTVSNPIHNIAFTGIQFSYATWTQPETPTGYSEIQSGYTITGTDGYANEGICKKSKPHTRCPYGAWTPEPGAVQFAHDQFIVFAGDQFAHLGGAALELGDDSRSDSVTTSVFTDTSGNGIELGGVDQPEVAPVAQTLDDTIRDNHIFGIGAEFHGSVAILVGYAAECTITHNQIDHVPYSGISVGWGGWRDKAGRPPVANYSHDNVVSDNLIFDFLEVLGDGGGIYNVGLTGDSLANGQKVTGNVIYGPLSWGWDLKSDDGTAYPSYIGNVLYGGSYDWGGGEPNTIANNGTDFPQLVQGNFWQQGDVKQKLQGVIQTDNTIIATPADAPAQIVDNAGIEQADSAVLSINPSGTEPPSAPTHVTVLYAYHDKAYVTWHDSFAEGAGPVLSYTVNACRVVPRNADTCVNGPAASSVISAATLESQGYAIIHGLVNGRHYSFSVTAANVAGVSPLSPRSPITVEGSMPAAISNEVGGLNLQAGPGNVRLTWYPPTTALSAIALVQRSHRNAIRHHGPSRWDPVLYYLIKCSNGTQFDAGGHNRMIVMNHGGRGLAVIPGMLPSQAYRISVRAVTPAGRSRAVTDWIIMPAS
jgi:hypothetical protein